METNSIAKFDYENFDYDRCFKEVKEKINKPNILICGGTGVGKSSLINDILSLSEYDKAEVGNAGRPMTRGIRMYSSEDDDIVLYDSEGYEIEDENTYGKFKEDIISIIDKKQKTNSADMTAWIHEVWYCISASNKRFFDYDEQLINAIKAKNVPIVIIVTKIDKSTQEELTNLIKTIKQKERNVDVFTYSTEIPEDSQNYLQYVQKTKIIEWAVNHLDESLKGGFISTVKSGITLKRNHVIAKVVPVYAASAAATVLASSFSPIPFTDSVPLMGIQTTMAMHIIRTYNIQSNVGDVIKGVLGTSTVSYLGKTLASQLIGLIPFVGNGVKIAVNTTVATTITATLGCALALVCEKYLKICVNSNGKNNISFIDFFTADTLKDAVNYVNNHKEEFNLNEIIKNSKN